MRSTTGSASAPDSLAARALAAYERALAIEPVDGAETPELPPHVAARVAELREHVTRRSPPAVVSPAQRRR